jgi:hypothetical protein
VERLITAEQARAASAATVLHAATRHRPTGDRHESAIGDIASTKPTPMTAKVLPHLAV